MAALHSTSTLKASLFPRYYYEGPNAAALYGSRAGNGVILVTTKKGTRKDGFGVNYSGTFTWTQVADELERQKKYGQGNNGEYSPQSIYSFGSELDGSLKTAWNGAEIPYLNYGSKMKDYFNTGFSQNHSVAIGNMKEDVHFHASFGYSNADGMFTGESLRKINIDLNAGMKMNKYLSMDAKVSLSNTKAENRPTYGAYGGRLHNYSLYPITYAFLTCHNTQPPKNFM